MTTIWFASGPVCCWNRLATCTARSPPARSLEEARPACRENGPFDLVLLDLNLPDAKGLQGLRTLLDDCPKVPFAMLTGLQAGFVIRQAQAMGAVGYLLKSWTPERLKDALRSLLGVRS